MNRISTKPPVFLTGCVLALFLAANAVQARAAGPAPKPAPDLLVFANGDRLTGTLDHEAGGTVFFKSDNAGMVQVPWAKLKELHTQTKFAVIENGVLVRRKKSNLDVPVGTVAVNGDTLSVDTAQGTRRVPVKNVEYLVGEGVFAKNVLHGQKLWQGITGSVTAGSSLVYSTQNSESVNSAVTLARGVPAVAWLPARERTLVNFSNSYGQVTEPGVPTVKTNILHGGLEEDQYFSPRFYLLEQGMWDHNFSQGLDLQQLYGVGLGYTVLKSAKQELDVTAVVDYTKQQFAATATGPATTTNLVGSSFGDTYMRKFTKNIVFNEAAAMNPAWNTPADYTANLSAGLTMTVFKNFGFTVGGIDSYLNNPPVGFKSNSVQFTTGLTYTVQ